MKRKTERRLFEYQYRSCNFCCSVDGLSVSNAQEEGDIIFCHVCGGPYLIQSVNPLRLQGLPPQSAHDSQALHIKREQYGK